MDSFVMDLPDTSDLDPLPIIEILEKHLLWIGQQQKKMYQAYKGQLKLSVYVNSGLLTIHVIQARHLACKSMLNGNTYVKLSLMPDDVRRTKCKTATIYESNNPMYDEKFSFELLDEDLKKRLIVSVWNKDEAKGKSEFLGCMSFGINHIQTSKRIVNGWYYLLTEEVGRRKHLKVVEKKSSTGVLSPIKNNNIEPARNDLHWMDSHIVVVKRTGSGYGFTVSGSVPVRVCKIETGSPAEVAGLQKDDCIVRINGQNVSTSSTDAVARLVRHSKKQLVLEVQRARPLQKLLASPWRPTMCSTFLPSSSDLSEEEDDYMSMQAPRDSLRSSSPPPLRLEDLEAHAAAPRFSMGSGGSIGSGYSSGSSRHYRESLV